MEELQLEHEYEDDFEIDFSTARPNPFAARMKHGYRIIIEHNNITEEDVRLAKEYDEERARRIRSQLSQTRKD